MGIQRFHRRDLPDGYTDAMRSLADTLLDGAETLQRDCRSGEVSDRYHACIDAHRLMARVAERLRALS
jgi:hypothetical protein